MFDINTLQELLIPAAILVPVITGLVEVVKQASGLPARWLPLVAVVFGASLGLLLIQATGLGAVVGIIVGLASVGLFEFGKSSVAPIVG